MKKEDVTGIIVWTLIIALVAVFMFVVVSQYFKYSNLNTWLYILYFAGALVAGLLFNAPLFELAHVVGAKIGHYNVTSVNMLGFCFYKDGEKWKFRFKSFDGLSGETTIVPNEKSKKKQNAILYCINGTIFYAFEIIGAIILFNYLNKIEGDVWAHNWAYFILTCAVVGGVILFYNIMPFKLDSMNDGYRLVLLSRQNKSGNKDAQITFNKKDETKVNMNTGMFSKDQKTNELYELLGKEEYTKALNMLDDILSKTGDIAAGNVYLNAKSNKIYLYIITHTIEESLAFYDKEVPLEERRDISQFVSMPAIRAYILMAGLLDKSQSECLFVIRKVAKAFKKTSDGCKDIEVKLFNLAIDKVQEAHPKWELGQYKMHLDK